MLDAAGFKGSNIFLRDVVTTIADSLAKKDADVFRADPMSRAVALAPDGVIGLWQRADALREKGDLDGALRDYKRALALAPLKQDRDFLKDRIERVEIERAFPRR